MGSEKQVSDVVQGLEEDLTEFLLESIPLDFGSSKNNCFGSLLEGLDKLSGIGLGRFEVLAVSAMSALGES